MSKYQNHINVSGTFSAHTPNRGEDAAPDPDPEPLAAERKRTGLRGGSLDATDLYLAEIRRSRLLTAEEEIALAKRVRTGEYELIVEEQDPSDWEDEG